MDKLFVCLLTGPAGAGKSTIAKLLSESVEKSAIVSVDDLHDMIVGGRVWQWPWSEEVRAQTELGADNACDLAHNFVKQGFNVIIDSVIGETLLARYKSKLNDVRFVSVLLLPRKDKLLERFDARRADDALRARTIELYDKFIEKRDKLDWQVIDTSDQSPEETVDTLLELLRG